MQPTQILSKCWLVIKLTRFVLSGYMPFKGLTKKWKYQNLHYRTSVKWLEMKDWSLPASIQCSSLRLVPKQRMGEILVYFPLIELFIHFLSFSVLCAFEELVQKVRQSFSLTYPLYLWSAFYFSTQIIQTPGLWEMDANLMRGMTLNDGAASVQPWSCSGYC